MPIIAIYALIAAALFGGGYGACWSRMTGEIAALNAQITLSNEDAKRKLLESITSTERAEQAQRDTNAQLEAEHVKNVDISNHLSDSLAATRMYIPTKHSYCSRAVSKIAGAAEPVIDATDRIELPTDFAELLRSETKRADSLRNYVFECQQFAMELNK